MTISRRLVRSSLRRAHREDGGQVLIFFAMFIVSVGLAMGVVGVDASFWHSERRRVQSAADAAALAAAQDIPSNDFPTIEATAKKYAAFDGYEDGKGGVTVDVHRPPLNGPHSTSPDYVEVIIHSPSAGFFIGAFSGGFAPNHGARAVAGWDTGSDGGGTSGAAACGFYVLNNTAAEALFVHGSGSLDVTNSCIQVNSNNGSEAAEIEGSGSGDIISSLASGGTQVVGGCIAGGGASMSQFNPTCSRTTLAADPLISAPSPRSVGAPRGLPPGCSGSPPVCNLSGSPTLYPGVYKQIGALSGGDVVLNAGIYVITGSLGGAGTIDATSGVVLYFACSTGSAPYYRPCTSADSTSVMSALTLSNNGSLTINAPTSAGCEASGTCAYKGMAIFFDQKNKAHITLSGNSSLNATGTIYAHAAKLQDDSGQDSSARSLVIVDQLELSEDGGLNVTYDPKDNYAIPGAVLTE